MPQVISLSISKNIDGENIEFGIFGDNLNEAARRIETWASVWCIRQFQLQVSIWRELGRIEPLNDTGSILELTRKAADASNWDKYIKAMGGNDCPRKDRPIKLVYKEAVDTFTGVLNENQYGESKAQSIYGLEHNCVRINTRPHYWKISRAS